MRKQSLIHVHTLLIQVHQELQESGDVPAGAFDEYEQFGVWHTSVHRGKDAHIEAIWLLFDGIDETIERQSDQFVTEDASIEKSQ
jgi:hypothetical protein